MTEFWLWWFGIVGPMGIVVGLGGWLAWRRGRDGVGSLLVGWTVLAVSGPPLLTLVTWLLAGDRAPTRSHEPWQYREAAAGWSIPLTVLSLPVVVLVALFWPLTEQRASNGDR